MGGPASPSVFQTTPPQPASKARTTLYSLSVGGAEASQNGFGLLMPAKVVLRSAMSGSGESIAGASASGGRATDPCEGLVLTRDAEHAIDRMRGDLAVLDGLDGQVLAAVGAVAAGPDLGQ